MAASDDLRELIDRMKHEEVDAAITGALEQVPDEDTSDDIVEVETPDAIREVFKQLALVKIQREAIEKVEKQLTQAANAIIGEHHGIKARGERLAKHSTNSVTRVKTAVVRELFPEENYPQLYTTTEETRLLLDPQFKKTIFAEATLNQEIEQ